MENNIPKSTNNATELGITLFRGNAILLTIVLINEISEARHYL